MECFQAICSYANRCVESIIEQTIEKISSCDVEIFSDHLTENIIVDALSTIANNENYWQKPKKNSITVEINEQQEHQNNSLQPNRYCSISVVRSSTNDNSSSKESIDSLVNNLSQEIYLDSFHQLRQ